MAQTKEAPANFVMPVATASHRFGLPDFSACGIWLLGELHERWPHLDERNVMGWLRGLIESPEYLFLRNDKAVLCAQRVNEALEPRPVVIEIFCCVQDGGVYDGAGLYREMKRWAESLGAWKVVVEEFTRVPHGLIQGALGQPIETDKVSMIRLRDTRPQ